MELDLILLLLFGVGIGITLFVVIGKLLRGRYFSRKTWYSYSSVKAPSNCCSTRRRRYDDRISIL